MGTDALRVAIVGCGRMGLQHARSSAQLGHRVTVACDVDAARANTLAAEYAGCRAVTDAAEIPWTEVDAVFVCTPPFARGPVEAFAAREGIPMFLEKPIGLSASQLQPVLRAVQERGAIAAVGYMNRYRASVKRVRSVLAAEPVLGFAGHWVGAAYKVPWWGDPALSGGQINEQCTHLIDLARHLVGEIVEVSAIAQPWPEGQGNAAVSTTLRFANGTVGTVFCGCLAKEKQIGCRIFTPRGQLVLDGWDFKWTQTPAFADVQEPQATHANVSPAADDPFRAEAAAFFDAIRSKDAASLLSDLRDALRTQRAVDAVRASLAEGRTVRVEAEPNQMERRDAVSFF